jgi:hypothetical protein
LSNGQGFFYSVFQGNKLNNNDVQGILNYVKAMDDGAIEAEAFSANLTGCSVAAQKYVKDANKAGKSTEQISAGLKDAAKAGGGFKGVATSIASSLANMAVGMVIGAAIQFAINTIITAFDNLVNAYKKSMEEMSNYQSNISSLKSEAESLNKELKDTKEKIAAIESINPTKLNLFDKAELQRLKAYNDELERKLRLNKAQLEVDAKSADKTAKWTYANSQVDFNPLNKYFGDNANAQWYDWVIPFLLTPYFWGSIFAKNATNAIQGNTWDQQMDYLSQTEQAQERYKKSVEEFEKFIATHDPVGEEYNKLLADKNQFENEFNNGYLANLSARYTDWQIELNSLNPDDLTNTERIKELEEAIARYDAIVNKMSGNKTFAEVYNSAEFSDVTKKLEELAKAGKLTEDTFNSVDGIDKFKEAIGETLTEGQTFADVITSIIARVNDLGVAAGDTGNQIKTLADRIAEINKDNSTSIKNISKIQNAISTMQSKDYLSFDDVSDLLEIDPSLADKFTQTTQGYKIAVEDLTEARKKYTEESKKSVQTELENTNSDISSKKDEIKKLQEEKKRYEGQLAEVGKARIISQDMLKGQLSNFSSNKALNVDEIKKNIDSYPQQEEEIAKKIKEIETNIDLANGKIEESEQLASVLKVILNEMSNPIDKQALFLSDVISKLSDAKDLLDTVKDEISSSGAISLETLEKISSSYPELENSVADYMTGLISASDLLKDVQKQYDNDTIAYRENIAEKIQLTDTELNNYLSYLNTKVKDSEDYYRNIGGLEKKFIDYMADNYSLDLESCRTWAQAKTAMMEQTKLAVYDADKLYDFETMSYRDGWTDFVNSNTLQTVEAVQSIFDNYESAVEEFGKRSAVFNKADEFVANSSSKKNSTKSTTNEVFDWIEVRLNRLADKTKSFFDKVSDYISNVTNERNLSKAITATQNEINANKRAEQKYRQKANSIKLSESWKKKVREGNFSINEVTNETLIKNIQDYQKWWEKARDSAQNIADLTEQKKDYLSQQFDSKYERQQRITDKYSTANDKINDIISYKENKGGKVSARDYDNLNRNLTSQNKSLSTQNKMLLQQQKTVQKGSAKWQEYKEKIDANSQSIRQNTIAIAENNNKKFDLKISDYERSVGNHERTITNVQNSMDLAKAQGKKTGDSYYRYMINTSKMQNTVLQKERNAIFNERKTVQYGSERYDELTEKLRGVDDQISENNKSQAEWNATIRNIPMDRLNEYLDIAEAIVSKTKSYIERISYINGESTVSANQIRSQKYSDTAIANQRELFNRYLDEFKKAKKEGRLSDADEYQKLYLQSASTYNEMLKANEELERQARDIELYRNYEKDLQHIEDVKKALSSLSDMINDDALYNDDGSFSEHGIAKIALTMKNLEEAKSSVYDYKKEIDALNKAHKQGKYNDDEYAEKLRELTDGYQNATSEVNNYTEAIKDLYKNQAQEELNALNELIDTRSEALQKKKEYYDYDKTIKSKTKDITAMQMQIEALNGVSTAEAKAQKALLEEQLSDLEEDLADTQADHIYQVQIDGLNEQKEILQDIYDKFVDSLNKCLDAEGTIISNATALSQNSIESVRKLLDDIAKARGYDLNYVDNNNTLAHFADGGKVISAKGKGRDDGVAWLKAGEFVLNEQAFKAFKYALPTIDNLADKMSTIVKSASNYDKAVSIGDVQLIVQGNVDRNVMDDLKKYQKQITDSVITNITKDLRKVGYKR